jgi:hypothetical protein
MVEYSAMKSYLEKSNLHYFNFSPDTEKPIKAVISHLSTGTPMKIVPTS